MQWDGPWTLFYLEGSGTTVCVCCWALVVVSYFAVCALAKRINVGDRNDCVCCSEYREQDAVVRAENGRRQRSGGRHCHCSGHRCADLGSPGEWIGFK